MNLKGDDNSKVYELNDDDWSVGSDSEGENPIVTMFRQMVGNVYMLRPDGKSYLCNGLIFDNVINYRKVLLDYAIEEGFGYIRLKNEKDKIIMHCAVEGCPWRIHASPMLGGQNFQVKTYNEEYTCTKLTINSLVTAEWLSLKFKQEFKDNSNIYVAQMFAKVKLRYGVKVKNSILYRAKNKALSRLCGGHDESYSKLHKYRNILRIKNPGTMVQVMAKRNDLSKNPTFQMFFLSFPA
ncbi:uncharacterized protein LOC125421555 [Ziziphus jujuba]|uniref:Uncharacterized protein LOC125421555 n=1 Tax=Ziziphus jujuba TaxID=326968 RepID=A0ABM3IEL2_ZIZJJ|nr:uncharacterized protein LOC125421555 [Ziziphus jujuba]